MAMELDRDPVMGPARIVHVMDAMLTAQDRARVMVLATQMLVEATEANRNMIIIRAPGDSQALLLYTGFFHHSNLATPVGKRIEICYHKLRVVLCILRDGPNRRRPSEVREGQQA